MAADGKVAEALVDAIDRVQNSHGSCPRDEPHCSLLSAVQAAACSGLSAEELWGLSILAWQSCLDTTCSEAIKELYKAGRQLYDAMATRGSKGPSVQANQRLVALVKISEKAARSKVHELLHEGMLELARQLVTSLDVDSLTQVRVLAASFKLAVVNEQAALRANLCTSLVTLLAQLPTEAHRQPAAVECARTCLQHVATMQQRQQHQQHQHQRNEVECQANRAELPQMLAILTQAQELLSAHGDHTASQDADGGTAVRELQLQVCELKARLLLQAGLAQDAARYAKDCWALCGVDVIGDDPATATLDVWLLMLQACLANQEIMWTAEEILSKCSTAKPTSRTWLTTVQRGLALLLRAMQPIPAGSNPCAVQHGIILSHVRNVVLTMVQRHGQAAAELAVSVTAGLLQVGSRPATAGLGQLPSTHTTTAAGRTVASHSIACDTASQPGTCPALDLLSEPPVIKLVSNAAEQIRGTCFRALYTHALAQHHAKCHHQARALLVAASLLAQTGPQEAACSRMVACCDMSMGDDMRAAQYLDLAQQQDPGACSTCLLQLRLMMQQQQWQAAEHVVALKLPACAGFHVGHLQAVYEEARSHWSSPGCQLAQAAATARLGCVAMSVYQQLLQQPGTAQHVAPVLPLPQACLQMIHACCRMASSVSEAANVSLHAVTDHHLTAATCSPDSSHISARQASTKSPTSSQAIGSLPQDVEEMVTRVVTWSAGSLCTAAQHASSPTSRPSEDNDGSACSPLVQDMRRLVQALQQLGAAAVGWRCWHLCVACMHACIKLADSLGCQAGGCLSELQRHVAVCVAAHGLLQQYHTMQSQQEQGSHKARALNSALELVQGVIRRLQPGAFSSKDKASVQSIAEAVPWVIRCVILLQLQLCILTGDKEEQFATQLQALCGLHQQQPQPLLVRELAELLHLCLMPGPHHSIELAAAIAGSLLRAAQRTPTLQHPSCVQALSLLHQHAQGPSSQLRVCHLACMLLEKWHAAESSLAPNSHDTSALASIDKADTISGRCRRIGSVWMQLLDWATQAHCNGTVQLALSKACIPKDSIEVPSLAAKQQSAGKGQLDLEAVCIGIKTSSSDVFKVVCSQEDANTDARADGKLLADSSALCSGVQQAGGELDARGGGVVVAIDCSDVTASDAAIVHQQGAGCVADTGSNRSTSSSNHSAGSSSQSCRATSPADNDDITGPERSVSREGSDAMHAEHQELHQSWSRLHNRLTALWTAAGRDSSPYVHKLHQVLQLLHRSFANAMCLQPRACGVEDREATKGCSYRTSAV